MPIAVKLRLSTGGISLSVEKHLCPLGFLCCNSLVPWFSAETAQFDTDVSHDSCLPLEPPLENERK